MPNWCSNRLSITGPPQELDRFRAEVAGSGEADRPLPLSFEAILPTPLEQLRDDEGETWRRTHWGTRQELDADDLRLEQEPGRIAYRFLTAGSPPLPLVQMLARRFPSLALSLVYAEPGFLLAGAANFARGVRTDAEQTSMDMDAALEVLARRWPEEADEWAEALTRV